MNHPHIFVAITMTLILALSGSAAALSPIDKEAALEADFDTLIDQARTAFGESDYEAALEYLVIANRLDDEPRLFLNIARSYEQLGQCEKALVYYEAFLRSDDDEPALIDRANQAIESGAPDCAAYHEDLGGRLLFESDPQLAAVYVDGELIGTTPTETVALEPGEVEIRFEREGYETYTESLEIISGGQMELRATLVEETEDKPVVERPPSVDRRGGLTDDSFSPNPISLGLIGAGVVGLGVGTYLDWVELRRIDEEQAREGSSTELTRRRQNVALATVGAYITGATLAVGGLIWLGYDYWNFTQDDDELTGWQLTPSVGPDGASMTLFRRF